MRSEWVHFEPELFDAYFDERPFYIRTRLASHPLFELPALVELARSLPSEFVEYNAGNLDVNQHGAQTPRTGLSVEETIRRIEECGSWLVLKRVDQVPEYKALLDECLEPLEHRARTRVRDTFDRQGFLFVSSPNAVTPFHMDPEHNFLLQLRGTKTIHMWNPEDRFVISEEDLETFHAAFSSRNLRYRPEFEATAYRLPLEPGQGLHFPVTAPHWVQNGPSVSVSFSITFRSELSARRERLHRLNARLRKLGVQPTPVGRNEWVDGAKFLSASLLHAANSLFGKEASEPLPVLAGNAVRVESDRA